MPVKELPKKKIFPFEKLPAELKNKIYFAALINGSEEVILASKTRQYRRTVHFATADDLKGTRRYRRWYLAPQPSTTSTVSITRPSLAPNLVVLNRQIYGEANPILYGSNSFTLADTSALHAFCANIGPKNCALLKEVSIKEWGFSTGHKAMNHPALTMLASAVNLDHLYLECAIHSWGSMQQVARQFFRDGHHFLEYLGSAKGRRDAAVEIVSLGEKNLKHTYSGTYRSTQGGHAKPEALVKEFQTELKKLLGASSDP